MDYRKLFEEENRQVEERYALSMERMEEILNEETKNPVFTDYFHAVADFILLIHDVAEMVKQDELKKKSLSTLRLLNEKLYEDVSLLHYPESYADPEYAVLILGEEYGPLLSMLYTEIRGMIVYAYEQRYVDLTICAELFLQIYAYFIQDERPKLSEIKSTLYWFFSDYADVTVPYRMREQCDPSLDFAARIIMESNLEDEKYLYYYGEYISDNERELAAFLAGMPEEKLQALADTYTEGLRKGFKRGGKDITKKKSVMIHYHLGMESIIRPVIRNFQKMGLESVLPRAAVNSVMRGTRQNGYHGANPNPQYLYDHRFDAASLLDKALVERRQDVTKQAYEQYGELMSVYGGITLLETFGEKPFTPQAKEEAIRLNENKRDLQIELSGALGRLRERYINSEETSFTIMALPVPEIGPKFEQIFEETVKVNNLDEETYCNVQQALIDALDAASYVKITGTNGNTTDMKVVLADLKNPAKETKFENCLADVNIPLGEVFTSPKLCGTEGRLNVSRVYLNGLLYKNLTVIFKDGFISGYSCENFPEEEKNKNYIRDNILFAHETLPLGEFAIGTNTTAYAMAKRYGIIQKLPILIVEKMGPHFAVGDTCYSYEEDTMTYNPDGKAIVARENECSAKRKEHPEEAYFNCHTDITIPYEEIGLIAAVKENGEEIALIRDGRFVLPGTEFLNEAIPLG